MDKKYILEHLTLFDKASLLVGFTNMTTRPIKEFDIPSLVMSDGPNGVRKENNGEVAIDNSVKTLPATCFPCGSAITASWDKELFYKVGKAIGLECRYYGINAILGPAINIKRNPLCGRNFEYLSEDPFLAGTLVSNYINGVQDQRVLACVKHYACNNLEKWRYVGDSIVDLRALNDIYLKPYEIAIKNSKPGMLMTSYNKINGTFASENVYLLLNRLRGKFDYKGLTVTDWGGMVNRDISLNAGQDLEMPGMVKENIQKLVDGVENKMIPLATLDNAVLRLLEAIEKTRVEPNHDEKIFEENEDVALEASLKSAVLLKNNNDILPLNINKKYVVIGDMFSNMRFQGSGSALINARKVVDNKTAFDLAGIKYNYARGYSANTEIINLALENEAVALASSADEIIFFGGLTDLSESEGFDRPNMKLDINQEHLLERLTELNKKIVFVMFGGSPFEIPNYDKIDAMLFMNLPGQMGGLSLTKLLFGEVSPVGHLAFSWPKRYEDVPYSDKFASCPNELYKESIFVGYRYFNTRKKDVLFPFGYGLNYGKHHYSDFKVKVDDKNIVVSFKAHNDSDISLSIVPQIYVGKVNSVILRENKELKGYAKVELNKKESKEVNINIDISDLSVFDLNSEKDLVEDGEYIIYLSEDVEHDVYSEKINVKGEQLSCSDKEKAYLNIEHLDHISDEEFFKLIGREIPTYKPAKRPYTLETPICEYKSFFGKIIRKQMLKKGDKVIKSARKVKDEKERIRQIKSGLFIKMMISQNCLRSLCYSAGGMLTYTMACGLLDLANGKIFRGIRKLTK